MQKSPQSGILQGFTVPASVMTNLHDIFQSNFNSGLDTYTYLTYTAKDENAHGSEKEKFYQGVCSTSKTKKSRRERFLVSRTDNKISNFVSGFNTQSYSEAPGININNIQYFEEEHTNAQNILQVAHDILGSTYDIKQHCLCTLVYILQNVKNKQEQVLANIIISNYNHKNDDDTYDEVMINLYKAIEQQSMDNIVETFIYYRADIENTNDTIIKPIKDCIHQYIDIIQKVQINDIDSLIIEHVYHVFVKQCFIWNEYTYVPKLYSINNTKLVKNEDINNLYTFMKNLTSIDNAKTRSQQLTAIKKKFESELMQCSETAKDELEEDFKEYTMDRIGEFIHIPGGHCYTASYLACATISNYGTLALPGINGSANNIERIINFISKYYSKPENRESQIDFLSIFAKYTPMEWEIIQKYTIKNTNSNTKNKWASFKFTNSNSGNSRTLAKGFETFDEKELKQLFTFMLHEFRDVQEDSIIMQAAFSTNNTVFDLIGLLGYICLSDDVSVTEDKQTESSFNISAHCIELFRNFMNETKKISLTPSLTLYGLLSGITLNGSKLADIVEATKNTCIHGIGRMFMSFYVCAYEATQRMVQRVKAKIETDDFDGRELFLKHSDYEAPDSETLLETLDNVFKLAPFIVPIPEEQNTLNGYMYATCVAYEGIKKKHPLAKNYAIGIFKHNGARFQWATDVLSHELNRADLSINNLNSFMNMSVREILSQKLVVKQPSLDFTAATAYTELLKTYGSHLRHVLSIPYQYQRERKVLFTTCVRHTLFVCKVLSDPKINKLSEKVTGYYNKICETCAVDEVMMTPTIAKYLTIVDQDTQQLGWNVNNVGNPVVNTTKFDRQNHHLYVGPLEGLINMRYTASKEGNNAVVMASSGPMKNIRKAYEYGRLLGRVLHPNMNVVEYFLKDKGNNTFSFTSPHLDSDTETLLKRDFASLQSYVEAMGAGYCSINEIVFKQLMDNVQVSFPSQKMLFIFKDEKVQTADDITVVTKVQAPYLLEKLKQKAPIEYDVIKALYKISNTDLLSAHKSVMLLNEVKVKISKTNSLHGISMGTIDNIKRSINLRLKLLLLITYMFFNGVVKYSEYAALFQNDSNIVLNNMFAALHRVYSNADNSHIAENIQQFYLCTVCLWRTIINPEYSVEIPHTKCLSIEEILKDFYLLKDIQKEFTRIDVNQPTKLAVNFQQPSDLPTAMSLPIDESSELARKYKLVGAFLNEKIAYYKDHESLRLKDHDYQDAIPLRFEYLLKTHVLDAHATRLIVYKQFEDMIYLVFNNQQKLLTKDPIEDMLLMLKPTFSKEPKDISIIERFWNIAQDYVPSTVQVGGKRYRPARFNKVI